MFLGFGLVLLWEMGKTLWAPTYFIRTFGMTPKQVGLLLGLMTLLFTSSGAVVGGWASERLARRGYRDAHLRAALFAAIACLPLAVVAMLLPSAAWSAALLCPVYFLGSFPFALAPAAIASITPNQMRAQLTAFYLLVINLLGFGLGPALIGALTDHLFHDEKSLRYSMALTAGLALPLAALLLYRAMGTYGRAVRELHELTA
jgi:MFS family permease